MEEHIKNIYKEKQKVVWKLVDTCIIPIITYAPMFFWTKNPMITLKKIHITLG